MTFTSPLAIVRDADRVRCLESGRPAAENRMPEKRVTGNLRLISRREGPVYYIRSRVPGREPEETNERLGPKWIERGRPPAGFYTPKMARDALRDYLAAASAAIGEPGAGAGVTFRQAATSACATSSTTDSASRPRWPTTAWSSSTTWWRSSVRRRRWRRSRRQTSTR